jgi:hypothetical protein
MSLLQAPFPWFGGKRRVAADVWRAFGNVRNYVEPFAGSLAVLLNRPQPFDGPETVNDKDGLLANFWRAVQAEPDTVARWADWPVNENDLHARHAWLVGQRPELTERLEGDPAFYDAQIAGWWVWGICCWIGSGWCAGDGPWLVDEDSRKLVHVGDAGMGVHRQLVHVGSAGMGAWFRSLSDRLRRVRVASGDWTRVLGESVTITHGVTGVFLDPPYPSDEHSVEYAASEDVSQAVYEWAVEHGQDTRLRIAFCTYDGAHPVPDGWQVHAWKAHGGYGSQGDGRGRANASREVIFFSPACLGAAAQPDLFSEATA